MSNGEVMKFPRGLTAIETKVLWSIVAEMFDAMFEHPPHWQPITLGAIASRADTDVGATARAILHFIDLELFRTSWFKEGDPDMVLRVIFPSARADGATGACFDFDVSLEEIKGRAA